MSAYIRFQTNVHCPYEDRPLGLFHATGVLQAEERIEEHLRATLDETLSWFNANLTVPRVPGKHWRCLFWYRDDCRRFVSRMWDLVAILVEHQVQVRQVHARDPGMIVYRDEHQVAALPSQRVSKWLRA
jgi:hypothetical protein